jgi:phosphatidylserine/phosphatidylglycerophosphate/cardiolipin synthase-like enzyme
MRHALRFAAPFAFVLAACGGDDESVAESFATALPYAEASPEALAIRAMLNDRAVDVAALDGPAKLDLRTAKALIAHRDGPDATVRGDDDPFDTLGEVDEVKYVGEKTIKQLLAYADAQGYLAAQLRKARHVVFSPHVYAESHLVDVAEAIDGAERSVDVLMYSFSDAGIMAALDRAHDRGVDVRFLFDPAASDKSKTGSALAATQSAKIEQLGIDVRYVNKILHHKVAIIDGPRDDLDSAAEATVITGSGNWSNGAGTKYDENTLFMTAYPELTLRMQGQFNLLWEHSRDFVFDPSFVPENSTVAVTEEMVPEEPGLHAFYTTDNFNLSNATTFTSNGGNEIADELVRAIQGAQTSIHIASGHLRSRPVAEALMAKVAASPSLDVKVLLDDQEWVSASYDSSQKKALAKCITDAGSDPKKQRACIDNGYYFGYQVGNASIAVRYKFYAYRWDASYALQMHHKYMLVDGTTLYTGSYNLSDNAEHETFENMLLFRGPEFTALVAEYEQNFASLWELGRAEGMLAALVDQMQNGTEVPLVFAPMTLDWKEVADLKTVIREECPLADSTDYRTNPAAHKICPK